MSEAINNGTVAVEPAVEAGTERTAEWLSAHRTTAEEQESARWAEQRTQDIAANRVLKDALGLNHETYRRQLEGLSSDERKALSEKSPEDIAAWLDDKADQARDRKKAEDDAAAEIEKAKEAQFVETPHLREVRQSMRASYQKAEALDKQIAELQRLNEMRHDPSDPAWDHLPAEKWKLARENNMESLDGEIIALTQQRQAALAEANLHQNAYHEGSRQLQPPPSQPVADNRPIGQIPGANGQPMPISRADLANMLQLERDDQAHQQRTAEAVKRYPDWERVGRNAVAAGADITAQQAAFIKTLPNSADVVYYLCSHPDELRSLARMAGHAATRALIEISHKAGRPNASAPEPPKTTKAPKPPEPVGGGTSRAFDVNDESTSADEWFRRRNADLRRRGKQ